MFTQTSRCALVPGGLLRDAGRAAAGGGSCCPQARRRFSVSRCQLIKAPVRREPRETVEIPGLEMVTYGERKHYVPGLAKPVHPHWEQTYKNPHMYRSPPAQQMALYKDKPCFVFHQRSSLLEGVRQTAWLTKTKVIPGFPSQLLSRAESAESQVPDLDEQVKNAIKHARFWDTTETRPHKRKYCNTLLLNLLHLCATAPPGRPAVGRRMFAENYSLGVSWKRGEDLFQVRGQNALLHSSMDPLPEVFGKDEVLDTADYVLETFSPISPTIDLQRVNVYKENMSCTGFKDNYPFPHAHTLYFLESADKRYHLRPDQFRAKMAMFTFGNALARAYRLYGTEPVRLLDRPITVQAVGTNGRIFQFLVFQLNTTDLTGDDGVKNQMWLDEDVQLYDFAKVRPYIKKKEVKVPAGLAGYKPEVFRKFLAMFLHGIM